MKENCLRDHSSNQNVTPAIKGVTYFLAHVPNMIRYGSKPSREIEAEPSFLTTVLDHLNPFEKAVAYPPNQVYIGNLDPDDLQKIPSPWYKNAIPDADSSELYAETLINGDPSWMGPLAGVSLDLPVFHIMEPEVKSQILTHSWRGRPPAL